MAAFNQWPRDLAAQIQVCAVQFPGRGDRFGEPLKTSCDILVEGVGVELMERLVDRPFALFGHSVGAVIAFELCRWLRRRGGPTPRMLFVAGRRAPSFPAAEPMLHTLANGDFLDAIGNYGGLPKETIQARELMDLFLPVLRADFEVDESYTYVPEAPLACPISAFGGKDDPIVPRAILDEWSRATSRAFSLRLFDGGHFFVETARAALLAAIEQDLDGLPTGRRGA